MAPARSVAASVVALGFAGTLTAPLPALAAPGCARAERYAAQSGAELLRIDRLDLKPGGRIADSRTKSSAGTGDKGADSEPDQADDSDPAPVGPDDVDSSVDPDDADDSETPAQPRPPRPRPAQPRAVQEKATGGQGGGAPQEAVSDVGLGNARSVLIAGAPVSSAGAARVLNGKVAGSAARNELVVQQAPPVQPKASERRTGPQRYGPLNVGAGALSARAVWKAGMECGSVEGPVSTASAEISRVAITGAGNGALIRVPEKISSRSGTALRRRAGTSQSVATASITAGRISLVDNEVRIRVLRSPQLTVTAGGKSRVDYRPAIVEIISRSGKQARLDTAGEYVDITLSDELRPLESTPAPLVPIGGLPLPTVPGLPVLSETENSPIPTGTDGSVMRISLGAVRQATDGAAIAAAATAIRVTVIRNDTTTDSKPSGVVADLGIGMLQAAAVAPGTSGGGTTGGGSTGGGTTGGGTGTGAPGAGSGAGAGPGTAVGTGTGDSGLPITGPRVASLLIAGAALVIGGVCAVVTTSRRRRRQP
ncbi:hypothetical protein [Actinoplanes derwentensis]|uniref:Gram-positive cocci surface proteins LPxTG domain-containing protein n=1 Tax=Actinoplanes derwentensis TaxID=113562 RepID=A0A1H2CQP9_9ACTN|nr:hypothetical protein [Actinoplanes derwentensis]GID83890.1 hypothetical protein Ade03nite_28140 [Actinoplanes derwentensis]SDT72396.1 hypothetical protein SAMN04489716_6399 [Actinoplanes derwentensis]